MYNILYHYIYYIIIYYYYIYIIYNIICVEIFKESINIVSVQCTYVHPVHGLSYKLSYADVESLKDVGNFIIIIHLLTVLYHHRKRGEISRQVL